MFRLQNIRFGIARLLFGLYVAVLINGVVFRHAHRLSDGTIICHAHPYQSSSGTQFPKHTHSRDELIWLDAFTNALYSNTDFVCWLPIVVTLFLLISPGSTLQPFYRTSPHVAFRHRGPPVCLV